MSHAFIRRAAAGCAAALTLAFAAAAPGAAQVVTGPNPALAPGQDQRAAGQIAPSTVYREPDGTPYVLKGPNEKQFLSGYNVTWVDKNHVIAPPGVGGFD